MRYITGMHDDFPDWADLTAPAIAALAARDAGLTVILAGHGPTLFAGLSKYVDLKLVSRLEFGSGAVAMRYEPIR